MHLNLRRVRRKQGSVFERCTYRRAPCRVIPARVQFDFCLSNLLRSTQAQLADVHWDVLLHEVDTSDVILLDVHGVRQGGDEIWYDTIFDFDAYQSTWNLDSAFEHAE